MLASLKYVVDHVASDYQMRQGYSLGQGQEQCVLAALLGHQLGPALSASDLLSSASPAFTSSNPLPCPEISSLIAARASDNAVKRSSPLLLALQSVMGTSRAMEKHGTTGLCLHSIETKSI